MELSETLRPYVFHGIYLAVKGGEALGDCPFCGREDKFTVNIENGLWRCFTCGIGGNTITFLQELWKFLDKETTNYQELADQRRLQPTSLMEWGLVFSPLVGSWLLPGYSAEGKLHQLYKLTPVKGKPRWLATPTLAHKLHGVNLYDHEKETVFIGEGFWDGVAFWEALACCKYDSTGRLINTTNIGVSLLSEANVLAVPGSNVFFESWLPLFSGKIVNFLWDNDHPRKHPKTGAMIAPAAMSGIRRAAQILRDSKKPPTAVNFLKWGEGTFEGLSGFNLDLPSGFDISDWFHDPLSI